MTELRTPPKLALSVARQIIAKLGTQKVPAKMHSVWVQTRVNEEGEFTDHVMVAINPEWPGNPDIPLEMKGYPVERVAWGEAAEV